MYSPAVNFDVAAESYDRFMGRYSILLSPQMVALAGIQPGQRAVDVGCGPGALVGELVRRLGPDGVAAVDPSDQFVQAARARHPGVTVLQASAEGLPFPDDAFDAALAQLVVHFMADPVAGLSEMRRVTRAGGVVAACVWDFGGGRAPLSTFWRAARELDPAVGDESERAGARQGHLVELFGAAGLVEVRETALEVELQHDSFEEWWRPYTEGVGPAGQFTQNLDADRRAHLRDRCLALLGPPPIRISAHAWAVRGVVAAAA